MAQRPRPIGMQCLDMARLPAGALAEPNAETVRGVFQRLARQRADAVAETGKAQSQIGVLGEIVIIPAADMVERGTAKII